MKEQEFELINRFVNGKYQIYELNNKSFNYEFYISSIKKLEELNIIPLSYSEIVNKISQ